MAKRPPETNRRKLIEEQRRKAHKKERRTTMLTVVLCSILGLALIGGAGWAVHQKNEKNKPPKPVALKTIGVAADKAGCDAVQDQTPDTNRKHTPGTIQYADAPPSSGPHNDTPYNPDQQKFFSRPDHPQVERAVHNLEHGYVDLWYDSKVTDAQLELLKKVASSAPRKFLVVPWSRSEFTGGKHLVLTAWGETQRCADVSGTVVEDFLNKHGGNAGKAPEKGLA